MNKRGALALIILSFLLVGVISFVAAQTSSEKQLCAVQAGCGFDTACDNDAYKNCIASKTSSVPTPAPPEMVKMEFYLELGNPYFHIFNQTLNSKRLFGNNNKILVECEKNKPCNNKYLGTFNLGSRDSGESCTADLSINVPTPGSDQGVTFSCTPTSPCSEFALKGCSVNPPAMGSIALSKQATTSTSYSGPLGPDGKPIAAEPTAALVIAQKNSGNNSSKFSFNKLIILSLIAAGLITIILGSKGKKSMKFSKKPSSYKLHHILNSNKYSNLIKDKRGFKFSLPWSSPASSIPEIPVLKPAGPLPWYAKPISVPAWLSGSGTLPLLGVAAVAVIGGLVIVPGIIYGAGCIKGPTCNEGFSQYAEDIKYIGKGLAHPIDLARGLYSGTLTLPSNPINNPPSTSGAPKINGGSPLPIESSLSVGFKPLYFTLELLKEEIYTTSDGKNATRKVTATAISGWRLAPEGTSEDVIVGAQKQEQQAKPAPATEDTPVTKAIKGTQTVWRKLTSGFGSGGSSGGSPAGGTTGGETTAKPAPTTTPSTTQSTAQKAATAVKNTLNKMVKAVSPSSKSTAVTPTPTTKVSTSISASEMAGDRAGTVEATTPAISAGGTAPVTITSGLPDTAPGANPSGAGGGASGGSSGGMGATATVQEFAECPQNATICALSPINGGTAIKNFSITMKIQSRTPMSCRYSQTQNFKFDDGTKFLEDVTPQPVTAHTDFLYGLELGSYTFYHQCKDANGGIVSLTHSFNVKSQADITATVTCNEIENNTLTTCVNVTALDTASAGNKQVDVSITNNDGQTVKIVRLGTEIQPELGGPQQTSRGAVIWVILLLVIASGALGFLVWRYKHLKNIEDSSAIKSEVVEIPQQASSIAYLLGI